MQFEYGCELNDFPNFGHVWLWTLALTLPMFAAANPPIPIDPGTRARLAIRLLIFVILLPSPCFATPLCNRILEQLATLPSDVVVDEKIQTIVSAVIDEGRRIVETNIQHPHEIPEDLNGYQFLFSPREIPFSLHGKAPMLNLRIPEDGQLWRLLSADEKSALLSALIETFNRGKYDWDVANSHDFEERLLRAGLGQKLYDLERQRAQDPEVSDSNLGSNVSVLLSSLIAPVNITPLVRLIRERRGRRYSLVFDKEIDLDVDPIPTGLSPAALLYQADRGGSVGICRHTAAACAGLALELGAPPDYVRLETGVWSPGVGHAWISLPRFGGRKHVNVIGRDENTPEQRPQSSGKDNPWHFPFLRSLSRDKLERPIFQSH